MNKAKVLSLALTLALVGCSPNPYFEIQKGDEVRVLTESIANLKYDSSNNPILPESVKVLEVNSEGILVKVPDRLFRGIKIYYPWTSVKEVWITRLSMAESAENPENPEAYRHIQEARRKLESAKQARLASAESLDEAVKDKNENTSPPTLPVEVK